MNEELVLERPRRLGDGDTLRLGSADAPIFVARFVAHDQAVSPSRSTLADKAGSQKLAELESAVQERDAELARLRALCKQLQARLNESEARVVVDAAHSSASMGELDTLHAELRDLRDSYAGAREDLSVVQGRCMELERQLDGERRRAQNSLGESERGRLQSEQELSRALGELAATRQALAAAMANIESMKNAYNDLLARLGAYEDTRSA